MTSNMKSEQEIFDSVAQVLHDTFGIDRERITPDSDLYTDLDIDSIDAIDLLVKLQKMTGKRLQPDAFKAVRKIRDVVDVIHKLVNEGA